MTREEAIAQWVEHEDRLGGAAAYARLTSGDWGRDLARIPEYMQPGIARWALFGVVPGDFLCAVIEGDLFEAAARADDVNRHHLWLYAYVLHNAVPAAAKGPGALSTWKGIWPKPDDPE